MLGRLVRDGPTLHHFDMECWSSACFERLCQGARLSSRQSFFESLKLRVHFAWIYEDPDHIPLRHTPPLKRLELDLSSAAVCDLSDSSPVVFLAASSVGSSLTSLAITFPAKSRCADYVSNFLSWCTNLESLAMTFSGETCYYYLPPNPPTTTLPKLKTLSLRGIRPRDFDRPAPHCLRTPALSTLTIRLHGYPSHIHDRSTPHLILKLMQSLGVLSPSSSTLHSLTLCRDRDTIVEMSMEELTGILAALPSLRYLSLNSIHFDAGQFLEASRLSPAFAAALEHLDLQRLEPQFQLQHILQFVKDRAVGRAVGQGLQSVPGFRSLTFSHGVGATALSEMYTTSPLVEELRTTFGLKIVRTVLSDV